MKKMVYLTIVLLNVFTAISYCKPMESIERYNVVLVHGAGGRYFGLDCDDSENEQEANYYKVENDYLKLIGGYGYPISNIGIDIDLSGEGLNISVGLEKRESSAEDMDKKNDDGEYDGLRHWLTENILEDSVEKKTVYLQRPFTNPANSPVNNARELGDPKWKGNNKCDVRRSLIEEAQEVRAKGRQNLKNYRTNPKYHYKDSLLPPSRNILIAHSLGGVSSREYVV